MIVATPCDSSQATMARAASAAKPCPCHGTPMTQAMSATRPPSVIVAWTNPTASSGSRVRTIQLCHASPPSGDRPTTWSPYRVRSSSCEGGQPPVNA